MPEVGFSHTAPYFCTPHIVAQVFFVIHHIGRNRFRETRPAAARLKLVTRGKKRFSRSHIYINAAVKFVEILIGKSSFRHPLLRDGILIRRQKAAESFLVRLRVQGTVNDRIRRPAHIDMAVAAGVLL